MYFDRVFNTWYMYEMFNWGVRRKMWIRVFLQLEEIYFSSTNKIECVLPCGKIQHFRKNFKIFGFKKISIFSALENAVNVLSRSSYIQRNNRFHTFEMDFKCLFLFEEFLDLGRSEY